MKKPLISLCMITRNEAEIIEACLQTAMPVTNEWIIVDTGSTDDTVSKCAALGAKTIEIKWEDDFAAARNVSLQEAQGEWILWLDADEQLDKKNAHFIRKAVTEATSDLIYVSVMNYYGESIEAYHSSHAYQMFQPRLFRNHRGISFHGAIHEQLVGFTPHHPPVTIDVPIHHYGYLADRVKAKQKSERNMKLLLKQVESPEYDPWYDYFIASEYSSLGKDFSALERLNKSIHGFIKQGKKPPSIIYSLKYNIIHRNQLSQLWPGIHLALQLYPDYVDLQIF